ncbi:hypothetical protein DL96DRAFT_1706932 [Flagelloscypha sp. PMI_526]|nr:hypothetical protein DL96DRAFT_1706932 [Flagelloscypha sp. PMI_526]
MAPITILSTLFSRAGSPGLNAASSAGADTSVSTGSIIGIIVAVVILLAIGIWGFIAHRRKSKAKAIEAAIQPPMSHVGGGGQIPYYGQQQQQQQQQQWVSPAYAPPQ